MGRSPQRVVFWDFDGTLARRAGMWSGALIDALASLGPHGLVADDLRPHLRAGFPWHAPDRIRGLRDATAWRSELRQVFVAAYLAAGVDRDMAVAASRNVAGQYYRPDAWEVIDGAREALERVRAAGYSSVILSLDPPIFTCCAAPYGHSGCVAAARKTSSLPSQRRLAAAPVWCRSLRCISVYPG